MRLRRRDKNQVSDEQNAVDVASQEPVPDTAEWSSIDVSAEWANNPSLPKAAPPEETLEGTKGLETSANFLEEPTLVATKLEDPPTVVVPPTDFNVMNTQVDDPPTAEFPGIVGNLGIPLPTQEDLEDDPPTEDLAPFDQAELPGHALSAPIEPGDEGEPAIQAKYAEETQTAEFPELPSYSELPKYSQPAEAEISLTDVSATNGSGARKFRPFPRVIAIANQKGGVGKTTTTVNLGAALSELSYRVLVIDLDPQGNATSGLGINTQNFDSSLYDVIMRDAPIEDCIEPTNVKNLFLTPATIDLAGVEIELVSAYSRELKLKRAVDTVANDFDFVLIDCPPSLGLLTVNGLAAATEVLVPIQCEYYALEGLGQLLRNVQLVANSLNGGLEVSTIVLTMYDARTRLAVDVAEQVREHFKDQVCRSIIPRSVRLSEAPSFGQPITVFDPSSRGAVAYRELAKEVSDGAQKRSG